jgi:glycosyltransferase involved in cell wall biosynthesis
MTIPKDEVGSDDLMFSVVIGTFNGAGKLEMALDALETQVTEFSFEVLVVNDASTDTTSQVAARPGVRLINLPINQGHGHTLNVGLAEASGQFMALMDDDCVPPPHWIQELGLAWRSVGSDVTMIGGLVEPLEVNTFNRRYLAFRPPLKPQEAELDEHAGFWSRLYFQFSPPQARLDSHPVFYTVGANMSVRVDAAREAGGFSDDRGPGEEESLARPLRSRFGPNTVQLFPSIVMRHNFDASLRDTFRRSRYYGRTNGRLWVRDRDIPSVAPLLPSAALVAACVAVISPLTSLLIFVLSPYVLYRRWYTWQKESGTRESIVYPYIQACEELASNVGFIQGAWRALKVQRDEGSRIGDSYTK